MKMTLGWLLALVLVAGVGSVAVAEENRGCHEVRGKYSLVFTSQGCTSPVGACYVGNLSGAGMLSGTLFLTITARPTLPGAFAAYNATGTITTQHGTISTNNVGFFLADPTQAGNFLQTDMAVMAGGTGQFTSVAGYLSSVGNGVPAYGPGNVFLGFSALEGEVTGRFCRGGAQ